MRHYVAAATRARSKAKHPVVGRNYVAFSKSKTNIDVPARSVSRVYFDRIKTKISDYYLIKFSMQYAKEAQNAFVASATAGKDSVDSYTAVQTAVRGVAEAGKVWEDAANAGKTAWADTVQAFKDQIADAKAKLDELKNNPVGVNLTCDTTAVDKALDALRSTKTTSSHRVDPNTADAFKAIADLKKDTYSTHYVTVKTVEEKASTSSPILPSVIPRSYYEGSSSMVGRYPQ